MNLRRWMAVLLTAFLVFTSLPMDAVRAAGTPVTEISPAAGDSAADPEESVIPPQEPEDDSAPVVTDPEADPEEDGSGEEVPAEEAEQEEDPEPAQEAEELTTGAYDDGEEEEPELLTPQRDDAPIEIVGDPDPDWPQPSRDWYTHYDYEIEGDTLWLIRAKGELSEYGYYTGNGEVSGNITIPATVEIKYTEYKVGLRGYRANEYNTNKQSIWYPCRKGVTGIKIQDGGISYPDGKPIKVLCDPDMNRMFSSLSAVTHIDLSGLDTTGVTDMSLMFCDCRKLDGLILDGLDTSQVTDMSWMFAQCEELDCEDLEGRPDVLDLSSFDTSNVTNMANMFYLDQELLEINFGENFNTGSVTNMSGMFDGCTVLDPLDVSGFDTSNVTTMEEMFEGCADINRLDVTGFNTSNVKSMEAMFSGCSQLLHMDVTGFDTSNVTTMKEMFKSVAMSSIDLSHFDTSNVTDMTGMFMYSKFKSLDLRSFDTSQVRSFSEMFSCNEDLKKIDLSNFDTSSAYSMENMFCRCEGLTYLDLTGFDTSGVSRFGYMFAGTKSLADLDIRSFDFTTMNNASENGTNYWNNCRNFLSPINWSGNAGVKRLYLPVNAMKWTDFSPVGDSGGSGWYDDKLTDVFYAGTQEQFEALENTWPEGVTFHYNYTDPIYDPDMADDWYTAYEFTDIPAADTIWLDCSREGMLEGRVVIPATATYYGKEYKIAIRPHPETGETLFAANKDSITSVRIDPGVIIGDATGLFKDMTKLAAVNIDGVVFAEGTSMKRMFAGSSALRMIKFGTIDTSHVTNMSEMFKGCASLPRIDLTSFDTSNVTDMSGMFEDCIVFNDPVRTKAFNTEKVTTMARLFKGCVKLSNAYRIVEHVTMDNVTDLNSMFMDCASLRTASFYSYNSHTDRVTDMRYMFAGCETMERLYLVNMDFTGVNAANAQGGIDYMEGFLSDTADHTCGVKELVLPLEAMKNTDLTVAHQLEAITYPGTMAQWNALGNTIAATTRVFCPSKATRVGIYHYETNKGTVDVTGGTINMQPNDYTSLSGKAEIKIDGKYYTYNVSQEDITFTSSVPGVAEVSDSGWVQAKKEGTAVITATAGDGSNATGKVTIKVGNVPKIIEVKSIEIKGSSHQLAKGKTMILTTYIEPQDATNKKVNWSSSDEKILKVSTNGVVTGVAAGTAKITAKSTDGLNVESAPYQITVTAAAERVRVTMGEEDLSGKKLSMDPEDPGKKTITLNAVAEAKKTDSTWSVDGVSQSFTWKSSNDAIVSVSQTGVVTARKNGTATITATAVDGSNKSAGVTVNVSTLMQEILITGPSVVTTKKTITLTAQAVPAGTANKTVTWTSSDNTKAKVDTAGRVTGMAAGEVTITATAKDGSGKSAGKEITVMAAAEQVTIYRGDPENEDVVTGKTLVFDPDAGEADRTVALQAVPMAMKNGSWSTDHVTREVTWKSSNPAVATVTIEENGVLVTAVGAGTAQITAMATDGTNKRGIVTINVSRLVQEITLTGADKVAAGKAVTLTAKVSPDSAKNKALDWVSSNTAVAAVAGGKVTVRAGQTGTFTITAKAKDGSGIESDPFEITITKPADKVVIKTGDDEVADQTIGIDPDRVDSVQLAAVASAAGAENGEVYQAFTWKSANVNVATVNDEGLVTAVGPGTAAITATAADGSGKSARVTINVSRLVQGINLTGADRVAAGKTATLTAVVTPDSAKNKTLDWVSSDPAVATVAGGKVTVRAGKTGTFTITAKAKDGSGIESDPFEITIAPPAAGVTIKKGEEIVSGRVIDQDLKTGNTADLTALCTDAKAQTDGLSQTVTWKSGNEKTAIVDQSGKVRFLAPGKAAITATATDGSNRSASVTFQVKRTDILLTGAVEVAAGKSVKLAAEGPAVTWSIRETDPANVLTNKEAGITAAGVLSVKNTVAAGTVITVEAKEKISDQAETYSVTVTKPSAKVLILHNDDDVTGGIIGADRDALLPVGLTVSVVDEQGEEEDVSQSVIWKTSNAKVATVDENGKVTPLSAGTAKITATTADGMNKSASVTFNVACLADSISIKAAGDATAIAQGKALQFTATASPVRTTGKTFDWSAVPDYSGVPDFHADSLPGNAVAISATGRLAVNAKVPAGTVIAVTATAKDGSGISSGEYSVTVTKPAMRVDLFAGEDPVVADHSLTGKKLGMDRDAIGGTVSLKAVAGAKAVFDGVTAGVGQEFIWSTSNARVATVNEQGIVTAAGAGTAQIRATAADGSGKSATVTINVASLVTGIVINGPETIPGGKAVSAKYTVTVTPVRASDKRVTWTMTYQLPQGAAPLGAADIRISTGTLSVSAKVPSGTQIKVKAAAVDGSRESVEKTVIVE